MKKPRHPVHEEGPNGWTEWISPKSRYVMICCDCGLAHTFEYRVYEVKAVDRRKGEWSMGSRLLRSEARVLMRAQRNPAETRRARKRKKV